MTTTSEKRRRFFVWWLSLIIFLLPSYLIRFKIGPVPTTLLEINIYLFFLCLVFFYGMKLGRGELRLRLNEYKKLLGPVGLVLLGGVVAVAVSPDKRSALGLFKAYFVDPFMLLGGSMALVHDRKDLPKLIKALGLSVLAVGLVSAMQALNILHSPQPWVSEVPRRLSSVFEYPNAVALYCLPVVGLLLGILIFRRENNRRQDVFNFLVVIAGTAAIYLAASRGALLALLGVGFVAGLFSRYRKWVLAGVVILVVFVLSAAPMRTRIRAITDRQDFSTSSRLEMWGASLKISEQKWATGVGLAGFQPAYKNEAAELGYPTDLDLLYPHNIILNFLVIFGLIGTAGFVWLVVVFYTKTAFLARQDNVRPLALGLIVAMSMLIMHGLVDVPFFKNDLAVLFLLIAVFPYLIQAAISGE